MTLRHPSHDFDDAVAAVCHGVASDEQLRALHELLRHDPAARDEYLIRVELHSRLASDPELFAPTDREIPGSVRLVAGTELSPLFRTDPDAGRARTRQWNWVMGLAACFALLLVGGWLLRHGLFGDRLGATSHAVAMLNRVVNARWNPADRTPSLGGPLEPGRLRLDSGLAQIIFYDGARVVIEGPAEFQLVSSSKAVLAGGKLTAEVPPQARGFRVDSPRIAVTDLGTSFGLNVGSERTELHVFAGKVEFKADSGGADQNLQGGKGAILEGTSAPKLIDADPSGFASLFDLQAKSVAADALRYDHWRAANQRLNRDPSLWVHLDFEHGSPSDWRLPNTGTRSAIVPDATIVGCQWQEGRWATKPALEFCGVSDRVRLAVPGAFESVTLAAWVRVQGLDRKINSLFMSDGLAPGTLHWLIRNDGVLGLTVFGPGPAYQILTSPRIITVDQFGIWTHLAVVIDGRSKQVVQYVNGQPVSQHTLRTGPPYQIGTAELGNWNAAGLPGNDPFLIRNFSGFIDEFCLFSRALNSGEVRSLYSDGKPQPDSVAVSNKN
jgi:hypothetical protein